MFDCQSLEHPLVLTTLLAALLIFSTSGIAIEIGELAPTFELRTADMKPIQVCLK